MVRIIPRLDIKWPNLIKGIQLEGLRVIGNPSEFARGYYQQGADEIILMDCVASLYNRNGLHDLVAQVAESIFVPICVGGGIRSTDDARSLLRSGADKVALNTAAFSRPELISDLADKFGSQAVVVSIEAKKISDDNWLCYYDNGREKSEYEILDWVKKVEELGAGEILLTSVDNEGTAIGYDVELIEAVTKNTKIPVIVSGGFGNAHHAKAAIDSGANAVSMARSLHYKNLTIGQIKQSLRDEGVEVRLV